MFHVEEKVGLIYPVMGGVEHFSSAKKIPGSGQYPLNVMAGKRLWT